MHPGIAPTTSPSVSIVSSPKLPTNFTSLPRELRDQTYELVLILWRPISDAFVLRHILKGNVFPIPTMAYTLLSPEASNAGIAREALECFFAKNKFEIDHSWPRSDNIIKHTNLAKGKEYIRDVAVYFESDLMMETLAQSLITLKGFLQYPSLRHLRVQVSERQRPEKDNFDKAFRSFAASWEWVNSKSNGGLLGDKTERQTKYGFHIIRTVDFRISKPKCGLDELKRLVECLKGLLGITTCSTWKE